MRNETTEYWTSRICDELFIDQDSENSKLIEDIVREILVAQYECINDYLAQYLPPLADEQGRVRVTQVASTLGEILGQLYYEAGVDEDDIIDTWDDVWR